MKWNFLGVHDASLLVVAGKAVERRVGRLALGQLARWGDALSTDLPGCDGKPGA